MARHAAPVVAVATALLLSGCGSSELPAPRGIGRHPNDLKAAPCACAELPLPGDDAASRRRFLDTLHRALEA
ncbi:putative lipoprotein [Azospirillum sp. OGB3]|uniref:hypothetical protein n=1 Tax=Azospirillum sp. OGB3 TaxID=2587012 RepID=UPI0016068403|nr:hypothetical protein [Azospirillum sp. OGB3]MBB3268392.1 putative lipoprotein [Azospirillum sp. OGB3]